MKKEYPIKKNEKKILRARAAETEEIPVHFLLNEEINHIPMVMCDKDEVEALKKVILLAMLYPMVRYIN